MLGLLSLVLLVILVVLLLRYFSMAEEVKKDFLKDLMVKFFAVVLTIACVYLFVRLLRFII